MTRTEIAQYIKSELAKDDAEIYLDIDDYKIIVEALEQEPILDKLRVEIMALRNIRAEEFDIYSDVFDDRVILRSDVLETLDKHKAESEEV